MYSGYELIWLFFVPVFGLAIGDCISSNKTEKIYKQRNCKCTVMRDLRCGSSEYHSILPGTLWILAVCRKCDSSDCY